jgi:hypothetical protein
MGKPLLRLLECYVLHAIGELASTDEAKLRAIEPDLARIYARSGSWIEIIASTMDLPSNLPDTILTMWRRNQIVARERGVPLTPQRFAEMFLDQNLV